MERSHPANSLVRKCAWILAVFLALHVGAVVQASAAVDDSRPSMGWRPVDGTVFAMTRVGDVVVLGGSFTQMVSATGSIANRSRLAAISATTGELLPWAPSSNGTVRALAASADGSVLYVGGSFTSLGGSPRTNLAAVNMTTGTLVSSFNVAPNGEVRALVLHDNGLFVGGTFWRIGSANRGGGAELDPQTGTLRSWDPRTNWGTYTLVPAPDGSGIFVGGPFSVVAGQDRAFLAKVSRSDGGLQPWQSGSTCQDQLNPCQVLSLVAEGDTLYVGAGGPGGRVSALDVTTGVQRWWTGGDGDVQAVALSGNSVIAGGHWDTSFNGAPRAGIVALDKFTGAVLNEPDVLIIGGTAIWSILVDGPTLRLGGQFVTVGGVSLARYTTLAITPDPSDTEAPARPGTPSSPATWDDSVTLRWTASSDNVSTVEYRVLRNGQQIGTSMSPFFRDISVAPASSYDYSVVARDGAGNQSVPSATRRITTPASEAKLLPRSASWRYLSRGTDPGATWMQDSFSDSGWSTGNGEFGFGDGDETTYISPLGVVHYFRTTFAVDDPARVESATLRLLVDDGAVAYINGAEIGRFNVPSGPVSNTTVASSSLGIPAEMTYQSITVPTGYLRSGTNVIAVSVHNQSASSSDVSFDTFLAASLRSVVTPPGKTTGLSGSVSGVSATLSWGTVAGATSYEVLRDGVKVGTAVATSFTDLGLSLGATYVYRVVAVNSAGAGEASDPLSVTTQAPQPPETPTGLVVSQTTSTTVALSWNSVQGAVDYVVARDGLPLPAVSTTSLTDSGRLPDTSYRYTVSARNAVGSSPESAAAIASTTAAVVTAYSVSGDTWRANDTGADLGTTWRAVGYADELWKSGPSELGYGDGDEDTVLAWGANANTKPVTVYFRRTFDAGQSVTDVNGMTLRALIDDGAVVYLNGAEVWRFNLPAGAVSTTTRASRFIAGSEEQQWRSITLPASALVAGLNTLAVEVHQDSPSSSDLTFDLELFPIR